MNRATLSFLFTYLLMLVVIFVLPFFSHPSYSLLRNTSSHLAAQHMPHAWIMNVTFLLLGITSLWAGWRFYKRFIFQKIVVSLFGLSLVGAAFFRHAPIDPALPVDLLQDYWHSVFATTTGISFTLLAISTAFILESNRARVVAVSVAILASVLSAAMFQWPHTWACSNAPCLLPVLVG
ncbi:MAG: DUF998 domain-containing protein [Flammeovirgaceae bacterium]